jgi:hypothetical protein
MEKRMEKFIICSSHVGTIIVFCSVRDNVRAKGDTHAPGECGDSEEEENLPERYSYSQTSFLT